MKDRTEEISQNIAQRDKKRKYEILSNIWRRSPTHLLGVPGGKSRKENRHLKIKIL